MTQIRLPRFRRAREVAPVELTSRDREILRQVLRHRFLRSSHLVALVSGSKQHILRRLQLLYHHGYLERPRAQLDYFLQGGSRTLVYGLGNKGAAVLKRELSLPFHQLKWGALNRDTGRLFLEHALLISDVMVGLEIACRNHEGVNLLTGAELCLPEVARDRREPFRWRVDVGGRSRCAVVPDQVFGLEVSGGRRVVYFLEADRATMPVKRENLSQSSFYRKLLAYEATLTQKIHRTRFGFDRFRVLTVTSSPGRVQTLVEAARGLERGRGLFLFTAAEAFLKALDPLNHPFETAHAGGSESLLESLSTDHPLLKG